MKTKADTYQEPIDAVSMDVEYGDEILSTGWNPAVDLVCREHLHVSTTEQVAMPADLATEVIGVFLNKMYAMQR